MTVSGKCIGFTTASTTVSSRTQELRRCPQRFPAKRGFGRHTFPTVLGFPPFGGRGCSAVWCSLPSAAQSRVLLAELGNARRSCAALSAFGLSGLVRPAPPGLFNFFIFRGWPDGQCEKIIRWKCSTVPKMNFRRIARLVLFALPACPCSRRTQRHDDNGCTKRAEPPSERESQV